MRKIIFIVILLLISNNSFAQMIFPPELLDEEGNLPNAVQVEVALHNGDIDKAFDLLSKELKANPKDSLALMYLAGLAGEHQDRAGEVIELFLELLAQEDNYNTRFMLAGTYMSIGRTQEAQEEYKKVLSMEATDPSTKRQAALILSRLVRSEQRDGYEQIVESYPVVIKDSPAPGCIQYAPGMSQMGGCFGKAIIKDLNVRPRIRCLSVGVNNCNGGIIEISNKCEEEFIIGDTKIKNDGYAYFELSRDNNNNVYINQPGNNCARYKPAIDDQLSITGFVGDKSVTISYTKTAPLCD